MEKTNFWSFGTTAFDTREIAQELNGVHVEVKGVALVSVACAVP
jgi:hypothetical protein